MFFDLAKPKIRNIKMQLHMHNSIVSSCKVRDNDFVEFSVNICDIKSMVCFICISFLSA